MSAIPQTCTAFHADLIAMAQAGNIGFVANTVVNGEIEFAGPHEEQEPFEPVIRVGQSVYDEVPVNREPGYFNDKRRINSILSAPLSRYLPEKDPREGGDVEAQERAWKVVRERNLNDLIDTIRMARAVNCVREPRQPFDTISILKYGFKSIGNLIRERGEKADVEDEERLAHLLVSALLLYEIGYPFQDGVHSDTVSGLADDFSEKGHHDGSAMLYEMARTMLPRYDSVNHLHERRRDNGAKAAEKWFDALAADPDNEAFMQRLWHGIRMAHDVDDHVLIRHFHNFHAGYLADNELEVGAGKAEVRKAWAGLELLKQHDYDLGASAMNRDVWERIGSDLGKAHSLFTVGKDLDLAAEAAVLSEQAYLIRAERT